MFLLFIELQLEAQNRLNLTFNILDLLVVGSSSSFFFENCAIIFFHLNSGKRKNEFLKNNSNYSTFDLHFNECNYVGGSYIGFVTRDIHVSRQKKIFSGIFFIMRRNLESQTLSCVQVFFFNSKNHPFFDSLVCTKWNTMPARPCGLLFQSLQSFD